MAMIYAYTATIPERVHTLKKSVESMLPQVDRMQVVLNNFKTVPNFLKRKNITCIFGDNSLEDGSRFKNIQDANGYAIVFDDDIQYPPDYVVHLIRKCNQLTESERCPVIVSPMGKIMKPRPIQHYYQDIEVRYKTFDLVTGDHQVDVPGACGILWNTKEVRITEKIVTRQIHHSDICVAKFAKDNGVKCFVVSHTADWLKNLMPELPKESPSIYNKYKRNDLELTNFINKFL